MVDDEDTIETVVDETVVVTRQPRAAAPEPEDRTVVVERPGRGRERDLDLDLDPDRTTAVERRGRNEKAPDPDSVLRVLPRRGVEAAPVEVDFGREAVEALGANVVETYVPREVAAVPVPGPSVPRGDASPRSEAPSLPSVTRSSRTAGVVTLLVFAGACVVSVIGVVAVIVWFVRS